MAGVLAWRAEFVVGTAEASGTSCVRSLPTFTIGAEEQILGITTGFVGLWKPDGAGQLTPGNWFLI